MKLFSWMHRKSKEDITSSFKGSADASSCAGLSLKSSIDNQGDYFKDCHYFKEFKDFSSENNYIVSTSEHIEIFPGFLTIGTLNMEPVTEPSTPTFGLSFEEEGIADNKYDLDLINEDPERFLNSEMEGNNEMGSEKSEASTITLSNEVKAEEVMQLYPLQGYLLGSSTEQCNLRETEKKGKMSLNGLFKKSKTKKQISFIQDGESDKKAANENNSFHNHTTKKQQTPPTCPEVFVASSGFARKPLPTVTKPSKIKSMFHKKIHPEIGIDIGNSKAATELTDVGKYENEKILKKSRSGFKKSNGVGCWTSLLNGKKRRSKTDLKLPPDAIINTNMDLRTKETVGCARSEHWIKTDAEYFVLEL